MGLLRSSKTALEGSERFDESRKAKFLMSIISTNDFFKHTGVEALRALAARDLINRDDYDEFTLPWRTQVGRIHPDDDAVALVRNRGMAGSGPEPKY